MPPARTSRPPFGAGSSSSSTHGRAFHSSISRNLSFKHPCPPSASAPRFSQGPAHGLAPSRPQSIRTSPWYTSAFSRGKHHGGRTTRTGGPITADLLQQIITEPRRIRATTAATAESSATATTRLRKTLRQLWAPSTLLGRSRIWARFLLWCRREGRRPDPDSACLFVMATAAAPTGQATYAKQLAGIFTALGIPHPGIQTLVRALKATASAIPRRQATPADKTLLLAWARRQHRAVELAVTLAWKCAARWGETSRLTPQNFLLISPRRIVVDWAAIPKGRRCDPDVPGRYTVIEGDLTSRLCHLLRRPWNNATLCPIGAGALTRLLRREPRMGGYSAHSIKRGAVTALTRQAAAGNISSDLISTLAKHQLRNPVVSPTTMAYAADRIALAVTIGTQRATRLL